MPPLRQEGAKSSGIPNPDQVFNQEAGTEPLRGQRLFYGKVGARRRHS
jgi:hypothetical protein